MAVQSKFISVGSVVPWAMAKAGAIATQARANVRWGPEGLELFRSGHSAEEVVRRLVDADPKRDERQIGVVDSQGSSAAYTGPKCYEWAGHVTGNGFSCQGNILFSNAVVEGMARAYESTPGDLPERLLATLAAGQREGGDRRGMQSAALLIVREQGGYDEGSDRWVDIRVDDHPSPIEEMKRVFQLYDLTLLSREDPKTLISITPEITKVLQHELGLLGFYSGRVTGTWDPATAQAYAKFISENNFENKARTDGTIWPSILDYLRKRSRQEVERRTKSAPIVPGALDRGPGGLSGTQPASATQRRSIDEPP